MRRIQRPLLSQQSITFLAKRSAHVQRSRSPVAEAKRLWPQQRNKTFQEIRGLLRKMASGLSRCMYCEDSEGTDIDHFYPKAMFPARAFMWTNYLLACSHCNSNEKRDQFPVDRRGKPLLINPTAENPLTHLDFVPDTGAFNARTRKGRESKQVFGLYRETLEDGRRLAWVALLELLEAYQRAKDAGDGDRARKLAEVVSRQPFSSVLWHLIAISGLPGASAVIPRFVLQALKRSPEIHTWGG